MRKKCSLSFSEILSQFLTPSVWKQAHQAWHPKITPHRWTLGPLIWGLLSITWCCGNSVEERFATARAVYVACHSKSRRPGDSLASFLAALERLPMAVLYALAHALRQKFAERFVEPLRINGWVPLACDGTRLECPRSEELERRLGTAGKPDSAPTVYLTALVLLPLGLPWAWRWGKGNANEQDHLRLLLPTLPKRALLVGDAFYQAYDLYTAIQQAGADFLVRLSSRSHLYTETKVPLKRFREGLAYYWPMKARDEKKPPLRVRVLRVRGQKVDVWLLTSVLDRAALNRKTAAQVYRWRWQNEGLFRQYKCLLAKTKLSGRSVFVVHREGEGAMLALALLLAQAAQVREKEQLMIVMGSPRQELLVIRGAMQAAVARLGPRQLQKFREMLQRVRCEQRQRTSSRIRREWPRRKEHKPPKPPKILKMSKKLKTLVDKYLNAG